MFIALLIITFFLAFIVSYIVVKIFDSSFSKILARIIRDDIGSAWHKYLRFAIIVVGISGGVRIWDLERYIAPRFSGEIQLALTTERWILEVYRTIIGTLQSIAWMLLIFFVIALIGYIIVKGQELKAERFSKS